MNKVLVTGATGFVGSYVVQKLLENNCEVIATSSSIGRAKQFSWFTGTRYIPFRLQDYDDNINYAEFFGWPEILIHLAWEGLPNYQSAFHVEENLPRHQAFLHNLIRNGLRDINITGTCLEYGMQEGCLSEEMPAWPGTPYAIAKDRLRRSMQDLEEGGSFAFKWIRLFYMYGKGQSPNSLLSQLNKALANGEQQFNMSGGEQERDYLPVEKAAENIVKIAMQNKVSGIINCCSGQAVKVKDFVKAYLESTGKDIFLNLGYYPYPDYEPMKFWGDNQKLRSVQ